LLDSGQRDFLVSHLEPAIRSMTAAHTFILSFIDGGVWPGLLDTIAAAPALTNLVVDNSPWLGEGRDIFDLPPTLGMPPLRRLSYIAPHALAASGYLLKPIKRPSRRLESETLRCHPAAPFQPHPAAPFQPFYVVPRDILPTSTTDKFLLHLQQLEIASLSPGDRITSVLPSGLEKLAVIEYPPLPDLYRHPRNILRASEFLDTILGVYLPAVTHLELWYMTDAADERFLRFLPHAFPSLQCLEMRRFIDPDMDATWNPGVRIHSNYVVGRQGIVVCSISARPYHFRARGYQHAR
jgi:hypothetical protein